MDSNKSNQKKWLVLASVAMGVFLATIDGSIVNVALPTLVKSLNTDFTIIQWVVLAYLLTVTTLMLSVGRLGDMFGKKILFVIGLIIFTSGSFLCGLASNVYTLIGFRVLQAIGASMIMALSSAIITEVFPAEERGKALGINGTMVSIGIIAGPTIGGMVLNYFSWHWIFFVNIPIGILGVIMVLKFVPVTKRAGEQIFDYLGAFLLFVTLLLFLFALTFGQGLGFTDLRVIGLFVSGIFFLSLFIMVEKRVKEPMIDLSMFNNVLFSINLVTGYFAFISSAGVIFLMPFYLQDMLGYTPSQAGLLMSVVPIMAGVIAPIAGGLSDKFGTRPLTVIGLVILLFGYIAVSTLSTQTTMLGYILRFIPVGIGIGLFQSPNNSAIMGASPRNRLGVASGMLSITRTMGQTTGIAVLGAVWASNVTRMVGEVSRAPLEIQVLGLTKTIHVVIILIGIAVLMAGWALIKWVRVQKEQKQNAHSNP